MTTGDINIVKELLAVSQSGPDEFTSDHNPRSAGSRPLLAFGGCTLGLAVLSACNTVSKPDFHVYSVLGSFHGFTRTDRLVVCRVTRTRDTRTFATRRVLVSQKQDDGQERTCAEIFVDFHVLEAELMKYSAAPSRDYGRGPTDPEATATTLEMGARLVEKGQLRQSSVDLFLKTFKLIDDFFDSRSCLAGESAQTFNGLTKNAQSSQDGLPITEKASAEWIRLRQPLANEAENAAALAFHMDAALSPLPLSLSRSNVFDAKIAAFSTLEFALRIMKPDIRMDRWHLKERTTVAAAAGRTYNEARLWDEEGSLVAIITQACILRAQTPKGKI